MAISETVAILACGTAVLSILFGIRLALRAMAGDAAEAPRSDGGEASAAGGSGAPDVAGVIALPPLIFLGFLIRAHRAYVLCDDLGPATSAPRQHKSHPQSRARRTRPRCR